MADLDLLKWGDERATGDAEAEAPAAVRAGAAAVRQPPVRLAHTAACADQAKRRRDDLKPTTGGVLVLAVHWVSLSAAAPSGGRAGEWRLTPAHLLLRGGQLRKVPELASI